MGHRLVLLAFYDNERDHTPGVVDLTWGDLTTLLSSVRRTACVPCPGHSCREKYGPSWSPVDIHTRRANANVEAVTALVLDLDSITPEQLAHVAAALAPYRYIAHGTHTAGSLRVVVELSRPVGAKEWPRFLANVVARLGLPVDPATKDLSRLYFLPSAPEGATVAFETNEGRSLDVDNFLGADTEPGRRPSPERTAPVSAPAFSPPVPQTPTPVLPTRVVEPGAISLAPLRAILQGAKRGAVAQDNHEKAKIFQRVLDGEALAVPGGTQNPGDLPVNRDETLNRISGMIAFQFPLDTPVEAFIEIMRPSIAAMDTAPEGIDYWLTEIRDQFQRARIRRQEMDAEARATQTAIANRLGVGHTTETEISENLYAALRAADRNETTHGEAGEVDEDGIPAGPPAWAHNLIYKASDPGEGLKQCGWNAYILISMMDGVKGMIRFNDVTKEIEIVGGRFVDVPISVLPVTVTNWLQSSCGVTLGINDVAAQIGKVSRDNHYDPLREYLESIVWDGTPRADLFLERYLGAKTKNAAGADVADYVRSISTKWLVSAVARALDPGVQVDTVLVLEGEQGIQKSKAFRILGGKWFTDGQSGSLGEKDSKMLTSCSWIIEMAELASFRKSDAETQKAFFTSPVDKFRPPYGRAIEEFKRRCVFVGTTNEDSYLHDPTGNRRYWPVACGEIDIEGLTAARDQLWAEAVCRYRAGERWWFQDKASEEQAAEQTAERVGDNPYASRIIEWWRGVAPANRPKTLTLYEVMINILQLPNDRIGKGLQMEIGHVMRGLGFDKQRLRDPETGLPGWYYKATPSLLSLPQSRVRTLISVPMPGAAVAT